MNYTQHREYRTIDGQSVLVDWQDEVAFFTNDATAFARFAERFDRSWVNTGDLQETFIVFNVGMRLQTHAEADTNPPVTRYENPVPDPKPLPDPPDIAFCFGGDQDCNADMIGPAIRGETERLDVVLYRINEQADVIDPLVAKARSGIPIRIIFETVEYERNESTRNAIRQIWSAAAAGNVQLKRRTHPGLMHIKSVIGTNFATWGSGNYTWPSSTRVRGLQSSYYQEDDFAVSTDPALVAAMRAQFDALWASDGFADFQP
jgi:hypothetical protein